MNEVKCPLCGQKAILLTPLNNKTERSYKCKICGFFCIKGWRLKDYNFINYEKIKRLIFAIRNTSNSDNFVVIQTFAQMEELTEKVPLPTTYKEKANLLINYLYENKQEASDGFILFGENCIMFGILDSQDLKLFMNYVEEENLMKFDLKMSSGGGRVNLTSKAINYIESGESKVKNQINNTQKSNKCFLVHGHNKELKLEIARFIETELKKKVIILHEQANKSQTIIEKFEANSDVDFAVCLYTADDLGKTNKKDSILKPRARQNVIFEAGYFMGKIGRENVIILKDEEVEKPSDNNGIVYISLIGQWKEDLRKEISAIYDAKN